LSEGIRRFFDYARERHAIYLRRRASLPGPWTADPILQSYSFTNVFRELAKTTVWFRENVRKKISDPAELLLATVVFRWFNRIATGQAIWGQHQLFGQETAWQQFLEERESDTPTAALRYAVGQICGAGPYVTGAYIIKTPDGYTKLDGVLRCIEWFMSQEHIDNSPVFGETMRDYKSVADELADRTDRTLESVWDWLREFPFLGDFMAYEIVTDLRHTPLLQNAPDILEWANPGPGATRGLGRVYHGDKDLWDQKRNKDHLIGLMRELLSMSRDAGYWPQCIHDEIQVGFDIGNWGLVEMAGHWPAWEMRDVEHTLCEFDKYERARTGEGRPRGRFRG